jgi:foldase protein PrsA
MKKIIKIMGCMVLVLALTGCKNKTTPSNGNDNVVSLTKTEYKISVDDLYQTLKERYATNYIIQEIDRTILDNEYKTDSEAKDYVENQVKIYKMMYNNSDSELLTAIQEYGYATLDEFKDALLISYKRSLAAKDYEKAFVKEDDIKKYYDENVYGDITISHILVKLDITETMTDEEKTEAQKKADDKIKEIYEKLDGGEKFADVAKEYSEDTATKKDGGKVGTYTKQEMIDKFNEEFEEAATKLKVGSYTKKTVKSSYGYHIIYKDEQKDKPKLEEVKDTIVDKLAKDLLDNDSKAQYKAMIKLREDYGLTFNDTEIENQYNNAVNNWLYGKES